MHDHMCCKTTLLPICCWQSMQLNGLAAQARRCIRFVSASGWRLQLLQSDSQRSSCSWLEHTALSRCLLCRQCAVLPIERRTRCASGIPSSNHAHWVAHQPALLGYPLPLVSFARVNWGPQGHEPLQLWLPKQVRYLHMKLRSGPVLSTFLQRSLRGKAGCQFAFS